jgi:hypothetical protein
LAAVTSGLTITVNTAVGAGSQANYTPVPTVLGSNGQLTNVDNRVQTITVSSSTNVKVGDAFTIAGVNAVHMINKQDTGQLQTFRVISVNPGGVANTLGITPAIVGAQGVSPTSAQLQYKNVEVVAPSATASLTFLNRTAAGQNIFWHKDAVMLIAGSYAPPKSQNGARSMMRPTNIGIDLMFTEFRDASLVTKYALDGRWGVSVTNPQMVGVEEFNQP